MGFVKSAYIKENFGGNKMFKKLKDKKGFTLVELIVVLVILAILAALLVPSLTGYIDRAKEEQLTSQTRMVLMAANSELAIADGNSTKIETAQTYAADTDNLIAQIVANAELPADKYGYTITKAKDTYKVKEIVLTDGTNYCKYTASDGKYTMKGVTEGATKGTFKLEIATD